MTDNSDVLRIREHVDRLLTREHDELYARVLACVAQVLNVEAGRIAPSSSLIDDLGAESLDFLDLVFRLETDHKVKIPRDGIRALVREGLGDRFEKAGVLTPEALARIRILMPEVDPARLAQGLRWHEVPGLFTVETFVRLLAWRLAEREAGTS